MVRLTLPLPSAAAGISPMQTPGSGQGWPGPGGRQLMFQQPSPAGNARTHMHHQGLYASVPHLSNNLAGGLPGVFVSLPPSVSMCVYVFLCVCAFVSVSTRACVRFVGCMYVRAHSRAFLCWCLQTILRSHCQVYACVCVYACARFGEHADAWNLKLLSLASCAHSNAAGTVCIFF